MADELNTLSSPLYEKLKEEELRKEELQAREFSSLDPTINLEVIKSTQDYLSKETGKEYLQRDANLYGELAGLGTEILGGVGLSSLNPKNAPLIPKVIKGVKGARNLSRISLLSPEIFSKAGTIPMWLLSEAFVWAGANAAGQWVRTKLSNHDFSLGELGAASLFGMAAAPVMQRAETAFSAIGRTAAEKQAIKLSGVTFADLNVVKNNIPLKRELAAKYGVPFITGAAFGMGETYLRESLELVMNERENRSTWQFMLASGAVGGSANSFFKLLGATKWGRNQTAKAADGAVEVAKKRLADAEKKLKDLKNKNPKSEKMKYWLMDQKKIAAKEFENLKGAIAFLEETSEAIKSSNKKMSSIEDEPVKNIKEIKEAVSVDRTPVIKDGEEVSKFRERTNELLVESKGDIIERAKEVEDTAWKEGVQKVGKLDVSIATRANKLNAEIEDEISESISAYTEKLTDGTIDAAEGKRLLSLVDDKIYNDTKLLDPYKKLFGGGLRSLRDDADLFRTPRGSEFSARAKKSQAEWKKFRDELKKNLDEKTPFDGITKRVDDIEISIKNVTTKGKEAAEAATRLRKAKKTYDPAKLVEQEIKRLEKAIQKEKDIAKAPEVAGEVKKPKAEQTQEIKQLKQELARQKKLSKDAEKYNKLQKELDKLLGMSPEDFLKLSKEKQAKKALKKQGPKTKTDQLKDDIQAKLKELRKAARAIERREALAKHNKFFSDLRDAYLANIWKSKSHLIFRTLSKWTTLRQLSLIDQLPSVMAGAYSGSWLVVKNGIGRPLATSFGEGLKSITPAKVLEWRGSKKKDWNISKQLVLNEWLSAAELFKDIGTTFKAAKIRAKTLENVTDVDAGKKFNIDEKEVSITKGASLINRAEASAQAIAERKTRLMESIDLSKNITARKLVNILSLGYRGIVAVDEVFYRQNLKANLHRSGGNKAILEAPNSPELQAKIKKKFIEDSWEKGSLGVPVLRETDENFAAINSTRIDMFYTLSKPESGDIHQTFSENIVKNIVPAFEDSHPAAKLVLAAFMPFINIAVRGFNLSVKTTTAPFVKAADIILPPRAYGVSKFYLDKNIKLNENINILKKEQKEFEIAGNKKEALQTAEEIIELQKAVDLNNTRRVEYEADYMSYALMGGAALTYGFTSQFSEEPLVTGSLSWMTDSQRKKALADGSQPYTMKTPFGNFDTRKGMPWNMALNLGANIGSFLKISELDQEARETGNGTPILKDDQDFVKVMLASIRDVTQEIPFNQGINLLEEIFGEKGEDKLIDSFTRLASSYSLNPAQIKKLARLYSGKGELSELKGGSYEDRVLYHFLGMATPNKKRDIFGVPLKSKTNFFTETIGIAPTSDTSSDFKEYTDIAGFDWQGILPTELPKTITSSVNMEDFINENGDTLADVFGVRIRKGKLKEKVKKYIYRNRSKFPKNLEGKAVLDTIRDAKGIDSIAVFVKLDKLIRDEWEKERKLILKLIRKGMFGKDFINSEEETLYDILKDYEDKEGIKGTVTVPSIKGF